MHETLSAEMPAAQGFQANRAVEVLRQRDSRLEVGLGAKARSRRFLA